MKQILIATGNDHKRQEFAEMLPGCEILTLKDLETPIDIEETGTTFEENALIKARTVHEVTGLAAMADDSGIEVDSLDGFPGLHSARWMGEDTSYEIKNAELLKMVEGKDRTARYVCAVAYVDEEGKETVVRDTLEGELATEPKGTHGFGYDPIFFYPPYGKTMGQVPEEMKHAVSHRGKALKKLIELHPELV